MILHDVCLSRKHSLYSNQWVVMERSGRHRNQLPSNLPQLQNLIKRDPQAYREEVGIRVGKLIWLGMKVMFNVSMYYSLV